MNWYIAKLVYQVIYGEGLYDAQFSEQLRLLEATDDVHAFTKAQLLGHREESALSNDMGCLIKWKFIDVCELTLINAMADGAEILSQITEPENTKIYVKIVQRLASQLLADSCDKCFHQN